MQLNRRLRALFGRPGKELRKVLPGLLDLRTQLENVELEMYQNPLEAIVRFFNLISPWHDRGIGLVIACLESVNYGQYAKVLSALRTLQAHFIKAGRDEYGINRTRYGQQVTGANIYLGNVYGLWTKNVNFWREPDNRKAVSWGFPGMEGVSPYDVVANQARGFVFGHTSAIIEAITVLEGSARATRLVR